MKFESKEKIVSNDDVKELIIERLKVISPDTIISIGSAGGFSRDNLMEEVKNETDIGELFAEMEMSWLKSQKER